MKAILEEREDGRFFVTIRVKDDYPISHLAKKIKVGEKYVNGIRENVDVYQTYLGIERWSDVGQTGTLEEGDKLNPNDEDVIDIQYLDVKS